MCVHVLSMYLKQSLKDSTMIYHNLITSSLNSNDLIFFLDWI